MTHGQSAAVISEVIDSNGRSPNTGNASRVTKLSIALSIEAVLLNILQLPQSLNFTFLFGDTGANITAQYLVGNGYWPGIDFAYLYGLLSLLVGRIWFSMTGATPIAYQSAMVATDVALAVGIARFAVNLNLSRVGILFLAVALPISIQASYWNFAHALEAALLCHALASQASGKTRESLALATAAIFAKPAMAFFYGALLLFVALFKLRASRRISWRAVEKFIAPSLVTAAVLAVVLTAVYGAIPLLRTILPLTGAHEYRTGHFGILGAGHYFLHFPGVRWGYYLGTVAGVWILGTIWLIGAAAVCAPRFIAAPSEHLSGEMAREMVLTCGVLQVVFVTVLFGTPGAWTYYPYVLIMGIAASSELSRRASYAVIGLAFLSLLGQKAMLQYSVRAWTTIRRDPDALGLWTSPDLADEWAKVRSLAKGHRATILTDYGCAEVEFPEFRKPVSLFLVQGLANSAEIERKAEEVSSSSLVIAPEIPLMNSGRLLQWPEFVNALKGFQLVWDGKYFKIFAKTGHSGRYSDDSPVAH